MNRNLSRKLLWGEALLLAVPLTGLLLLGASGSVATISSGYEFWPWGARDCITGLALIAVAAGWWLIIAAIRHGAEGLRAANRGWWLASSFGPILILAAIASMLLPSSPEYSSSALFREHLESCVVASPLLLVLGHLWMEARFRKSANNAMHATCEDARA